MATVSLTCRRFAASAAAVLLGAALFIASPARAGIVLQQSPTLSGGGVTSDTASIRSFEDFRLSAAATITDIRWWGSVTRIPGVYDPLSGPMAFTISFYANDGIFPSSTPIYQQVVSATGSDASPMYGVFQFDAHLSTPVDLAGGEVLWISIAGHDLAAGHSFAIPFEWGSATADAPGALLPGIAASQFPGSDPFLQGTRLAFVLESNPIPEPGTLSLLGLGVVGLAFVRRRGAKVRVE